MGNARHRIVFGISLACLGALSFVVASSYIIARGLPWWLAAAVGGLAFPVGPVTWHVIGERRRKARRAAAKTPPKATLSGPDRYWLRFAAVVLLVIGPMVAIGRFEVVRAAWHHGLWFVPRTAPSAVRSDLLRRVPADAELVIVLHPPESAKAHGEAGSLVVAWGGGEAMIAADAALEAGEDHARQLEQINAQRDRFKWLDVAPLSELKTSDKIVLVASDGWRTKVDPPGSGPSAALRTELGRAPSDAVFVAAFVPRTTRDVDSTRSGVVWATVTDDALVVEARAEAVDDASAAKLVDDLSGVLHGKTPDIPEACRGPVAKLADRIHLAHDGATVTGHAELPKDAIASLMLCAMAG